MIKGSIVALITPFKNGKIDDQTLISLIEWHIQEGSHGIFVCGTTGEAFTLTHDEQKHLISLTVKTVKGRIPVIAGASAVSTENTIFLTQQAKEAGADIALVVAPPYIKPSQEGLYQHFLAVHNAVDIPLIVYNNPKRASVRIENETIVRLAKLERLIAVKDSTNDLDRPVNIRLLGGENLLQFSGEDTTIVAFLAHGGNGNISITPNVAPRLCAQLYEAWEAKEFETVARLRDQLMPLHHAVFIESSPAPTKYALSLLGRCSEEVRLPLLPMTDNGKAVVREAMRFADLLDEEEG